LAIEDECSLSLAECELKTKLIFPLTIFLFVVGAKAQNTFPSSGNVGIGIVTPVNPLNLTDTSNSQTIASFEIDSTAQYPFLINQMGFAAWAFSGAAGNIMTFGPFSGRGSFNINYEPNVTGFTLNYLGNVGIGTTSPGEKLDVAGNIKMNTGGAHLIFPDGSLQSTAWNGTLCGGDYAESIDVKGERTQYEPGDVLVVDPQDPGKFLKSSEPYSMAVSGVYSTKPGLVGRRQTTDPEASTSEIPMAMVGIVPTKVSAENGPIHPGDILVTSSTLGHAMKGTDRSQFAGSIVGKALGSLDSGTGVIEVLISLQ
jgi:hypothetical protein